MSIYHNPQNYADQTGITIEEAEARCKHFVEIEKLKEEVSKCPNCEEKTLEYVEGNFMQSEEGSIVCMNSERLMIDGCKDECGFTSPVSKKYEVLVDWYGFDKLLMDSVYKKEKESKEGKIIGHRRSNRYKPKMGKRYTTR